MLDGCMVMPKAMSLCLDTVPFCTCLPGTHCLGYYFTLWDEYNDSHYKAVREGSHSHSIVVKPLHSFGMFERALDNAANR